MKIRRFIAENWFDLANAFFLLGLALIAVYPFLYILGLSISPSGEIARGEIWLLPERFYWGAYEMVLKDASIRMGYLNTLFRTTTGTLLTLTLTALLAYPLSRPQMPWRRQITFFLLFTMLFSGGLVPKYMLLKNLGLINSLWVLVLPVMLTAFNVIILKNFFQLIPASYAEAARLDGASEFQILVRIFIPLSMPALATIALWTCVMHWNSWFDSIVFVTNDGKQVLQVFLLRVVIDNSIRDLQFGVQEFDSANFSGESLKAALVVVTLLPVIAVYPFLQRYFIRGITLGGIKE